MKFSFPLSLACLLFIFSTASCEVQNITTIDEFDTKVFTVSCPKKTSRIGAPIPEACRGGLYFGRLWRTLWWNGENRWKSGSLWFFSPKSPLISLSECRWRRRFLHRRYGHGLRDYWTSENPQHADRNLLQRRERSQPSQRSARHGRATEDYQWSRVYVNSSVLSILIVFNKNMILVSCFFSHLPVLCVCPIYDVIVWLRKLLWCWCVNCEKDGMTFW